MLFYYNFVLADMFHIFDKNQKTSFSSLFPIPSENLNFQSNFDFKIRRDNQKISYEYRVYESVDDTVNFIQYNNIGHY